MWIISSLSPFIGSTVSANYLAQRKPIYRAYYPLDLPTFAIVCLTHAPTLMDGKEYDGEMKHIIFQYHFLWMILQSIDTYAMRWFMDDIRTLRVWWQVTFLEWKYSLSIRTLRNTWPVSLWNDQCVHLFYFLVDKDAHAACVWLFQWLIDLKNAISFPIHNTWNVIHFFFIWQ